MVNAQNCNCACNLMMAETEGIKLDLVILNNQFETGKNLKNTSFSRTKRKTRNFEKLSIQEPVTVKMK